MTAQLDWLAVIVVALVLPGLLLLVGVVVVLTTRARASRKDRSDA